MLLEQEYVIRVTIVREMREGEPGIPAEQYGQRICWGIEKDLPMLSKGRPVSACLEGWKEREIPDAGSQVQAAPAVTGVSAAAGAARSRARERTREIGYHGKKRWMVSHRLRGTRIITARSPEMAICTAAACFGIGVSEERDQILVRRVEE